MKGKNKYKGWEKLEENEGGRRGEKEKSEEEKEETKKSIWEKGRREKLVR